MKVTGDEVRVSDAGFVGLIDPMTGKTVSERVWHAKGDSVVQVEGWVKLVMRERGKIVPGSFREGHNIWTNTGREYLALLMSSNAGPVAFRTDRITYLGLGTGAQVEEAGVLGLVTPVAFSTGQFLAPFDVPPTFPLSPTRTTVRYRRVFVEDEITITPGSTVNISEMGMFTNGRQSDYAVGLRDTTIGSSAAQSPAAYKALEPVGKKDSLQLEVSWEIRF